jgi:hypothetical protein
MRRNSHFTLAIAGFAAAVLLAVAGGWKVSQITYIASLVAFGLAGLAFLSSLAALTLGHRPEITHEVIAGTPVSHA